MKAFLGVVMALGLVRVQGRKPNHGSCVDDYCVTVHTDVVDFNSAQKSCKDNGGHLMTVRTMAANSVISDLLTGYTGHFWIGLRYMSNSCADSTMDLKGYTWITGDKATNFTNWKKHGISCSQRCVSLSKSDPKWTERQCNYTIEGYLCEYANVNKCTRLPSESPVQYETPFGFSSEDLQDVPNASNATQQNLGTKYICADGSWIKAPWNCEVYKGGCEHTCYKWNNTFSCTCLPGYKLESNAVRCSKAHSDPCVQANCSQECVVKGENYVCQCLNGYELGKDGKTCKEIDNCNNKQLCPEENSYCVNTADGFECRCKTGFRKEKDTCEDDDECFSGPCEHTCNNNVGSYNCECLEGYRVSSENKHECTLHCSQFECLAVDCDINKPHQCSCPAGFILEERPNGGVCVDIDECQESDCDQNCMNTPGSYNCSCTEGFHIIGNTKCVKTKELSTTTSVGIFTPTTRNPPIKTGLCTPEFLLGIIVFAVMVILLMVCVIHHNMKRCGNITTNKSRGKDVHALQQVTTEKYVKKGSITNDNYN